MYRIRIRLPKREYARYRHLDLLHDALINAWITAGAEPRQVLGNHAQPWNFAALGGRRDSEGWVHTLVVSTPDSELARFLTRFDTAQVRQARAGTAELADFSKAEILPDPDPIPPGEGILSVLMLSPLAISYCEQGRRLWYRHLTACDLAAAVNGRLSRLGGRSVRLQVLPDSLYLRANPNHSVLVSLKRMSNGRHAFVIGMSAPLVFAGVEADLRLAWYAGIGEKTRSGFGCIGLLERGVGR